MKAFPMMCACLSVVAVLCAGCAAPEPQPVDPGEPQMAEADGLQLKLEVSDHEVAVGDKLKVTLTAVNTHDEPINITSRTGALMLVHIWRETWAGWTTVKKYPEAATMAIVPWTLEAGEQREFDMDLTVGRDWPTAETIRLSAKLNGRPDVRPTVEIDVAPRDGE